MNEIEEYYAAYDEIGRLTKDNSHRVEFLTISEAMNGLLCASSRILDVAAGPGTYAFYLADKGHSVSVQDLSDRHIRILTKRNAGAEEKLESIEPHDIRAGLSYPQGVFDTVLCMGPIYHLGTQEERSACLSECVRVLKPGGLIFVTYLITPNKDVGDSQKARDFYQHHPYFYTNTPEAAVALVRNAKVRVVDHFSSDGISLRISSFVNDMNDCEFQNWLSFHRSICRNTITFRFAIHGVVIGRKSDHGT